MQGFLSRLLAVIAFAATGLAAEALASPTATLTTSVTSCNPAGGTVNFSLHRDGAFAMLRIANTGPGLPAELRSRVFERFFRGDTSHDNAVEGCGLGLSIAQWIVTAHRGEIDFASEPEQLTTVSVRLPLG